MNTDERLDRIDQTINKLTELAMLQSNNLRDLMDTSNARMTRIEDALESLIRAMTTEHSNGKAH